MKKNGLSRFVPVRLDRHYHVGRDDLWYPVDWDRDGKIDLLLGVSDWRDYGNDDAFDEHGRWTRGPLHGYIYFHRNIGTNQNPVYAEPILLSAGGKPIDRYGSPTPNPAEWFGTGRLDLVSGDFIDSVSVFRAGAGGLDPAVPLTFGPAKQPNGVTWTMQSSGTTASLNAVSFTDRGNRRRLERHDSAHHRWRRDLGSQWPVASYSFTGVVFTDAKNGVAIAYNNSRSSPTGPVNPGCILRTTDGGIT